MSFGFNFFAIVFAVIVVIIVSVFSYLNMKKKREQAVKDMAEEDKNREEMKNKKRS